MIPRPVPSTPAHATRPRRRRVRGLAVLSTGLLALGAIAGAPAAVGSLGAGADTDAGPPIVVKVAKLDRGSHAKVPWLHSNVVHTATGKTVTLPWKPERARDRLRSLLGHTSRGWMLRSSDGEYMQRLWVATHKKRTSLESDGVSGGENINFFLSDDAQRYLTDGSDGESTSMRVNTLGGAQVASRSFDYEYGWVLDFSGPRAVVGGGSALAQLWTVDSDTVEDLGTAALTADLAHDLLIAYDPESGESGPTAISAPAEPAWTAPMKEAVVSPGGGRVLSSDPDNLNLLTVRSVETGAVQVSFKIRYRFRAAPVWEDNNSFVLIAQRLENDSDGPKALVRCTLAGTCVRVSGWMTSRISLQDGVG